MNAALHTESDAVARLAAARPMVVDVVPASEISAHHAAGGVSHAGPPIEPERMCPPMRAALGSALWLEGVAETPAAALALVEDGEIPLTTNHDAGGVGPMAGVVNPSMPVWVARDEATGKVAWCPLNEGSGAVLRYGADGPEVLERLIWMKDVLAPELRRALDGAPLDLFDLHVQSIALGDEAHHRTEQGTALTLDALGIEQPEVRAFIAGNGQFFLNLAMLFSKLALDCAADVPGSPVLTAIARNGVEVGIRVSGLGDQWFVGPAALPAPAKLFPGYTPADMNPDLGDSAIVETYGLGALAVAASPISAPSVGLDVHAIDAIDTELRAIAAGESPDIRFPDGRAAILGIDARKVAATRLSPPVHTGIAHKQPGIGQIGGGVTHPPLQAFDLAVQALDAR
ncbi:DUF1116 domain-containing protein [Solirubrobacter phytolaccae]|uniref:DUF1116 domain-containing protein n=1 Tax=Solirubrobacter phytolaccae TaxID=1404360 RepID=A0A9X3SCX6_9ACTN|nr:DUF1116 domain-containing protein [Solirubrobacter phytolaccae]MDA0179177.1 DUF1116 domain-containing protein [Solirubrobacter phytolaccae]